MDEIYAAPYLCISKSFLNDNNPNCKMEYARLKIHA